MCPVLHRSAFDEGSNQGPFFMYDGGYIVGDKPVVVVTGAWWRPGRTAIAPAAA